MDPVSTFRIEANEHLTVLEETLLELESDPSSSELINRAFGSMHTIKGSAGMVGFQSISDFAHNLENALVLMKEGTVAADSALISVMLEANDHIKLLLEHQSPTTDIVIAGNNILQNLEAHIPSAVGMSASNAVQPTAEQPVKADRENVFRIRIKPSKDTFKSGFDLVPVVKELNTLGKAQLVPGNDKVPTLEGLDPEACYLELDIVLISDQPVSEIEDVFIFVADDWDINIETVDPATLLTSSINNVNDRLGDILLERGIISQAQLDSLLKNQTRLGESLQSQGLVTPQQLESALAEQKAIRNTREKNNPELKGPLIRVPATRLDKLMDLIGELVIVQARMQQASQAQGGSELNSISEDLGYLTTELRDITFSVRMIPIGSIFGQFRRLVRDLSKEMNKKIDLITEGAETELDKMVIDKLSEPLIHLVRNSIDHGIETIENRQAAGKNEKGTIRMVAEHSESKVSIRVEDDGKGLDVESIRHKAIEKNLISEADRPGDQEILNLIFEPGFSTADKVSDISGRGVGMDIVKRTIHELGGSIDIASDPGQGTRFIINLPLTLAIIEGLMVSVADEQYVLPLSMVEECVEIVSNRGGLGEQTYFKVRGELIPFVRLRQWFGVNGKQPDIEQMVVINTEKERFGFVVDEVIGQYQTVIKRLGKLYDDVSGFSGATIMGDGRVAMIIDVVGLIETLEREQNLLEKCG